MKSVLIISLILLLAGCSNKDRNDLMIAEQGSFTVGGTVLNDSLGRSFHGDHAYVFYQKPVDARKYPLVFAHGVGQCTKTWETTPDGREGFQNIFLRKWFSTYLVDRPRRGDAGRSTVEAVITPTFDEEVWFNRFRVGIWPDYFEGVQFSRDPEALNQYFRQMTGMDGHGMWERTVGTKRNAGPRTSPICIQLKDRKLQNIVVRGPHKKVGIANMIVLHHAVSQ